MAMTPRVRCAYVFTYALIVTLDCTPLHIYELVQPRGSRCFCQLFFPTQFCEIRAETLQGAPVLEYAYDQTIQSVICFMFSKRRSYMAVSRQLLMMTFSRKSKEKKKRKRKKRPTLKLLIAVDESDANHVEKTKKIEKLETLG